MSGATDGERVAAAALAMVGTRFRLHGRDPRDGLDCVGLVAHALAASGWIGEVPTGYALRGGDPARVTVMLDGLLPRGDGSRPGAILLAAPGPAQLHLAIRTADGIVHADAGLRRVVERPGPPPWPIIAAWQTEGD